MLRSNIITIGNSWTVPAGVSAVWVVATGSGGGAGGAISGGGPGSLSGAASGETVISAMIPVTPGGTFTPTIGAGPAGGGNSPQPAGNPTSFGPHIVLGPPVGNGPSAVSFQKGGGDGGGKDDGIRGSAFPIADSCRWWGGFGADHQTAPATNGFGIDATGGLAGVNTVSGARPGNGGSGNLFHDGGMGGDGRANGIAATGWGGGGGGGGGANGAFPTTGGAGKEGVCIVFWTEPV